MTLRDMLILLDADDEEKAKIWLNNGYRILGAVAKIPSEATVTLYPDFTLYDLPKDLVELDGVYIDGKALDKINEKHIDSATGTPKYYYKRGNYIGFYPKADSEITAIIHYFQYPDPLVNNTDTPKIPEEFHQAIVDYAKAMKIKDDDPDPEDLTIAENFLSDFYRAREELKRYANTNDNAPMVIQDVYGVW